MLKQLQFLDKNENRDTFFRRVHQFVLPYHEDAILVAKAYQIAKDEFRGKKRARGERYFEHCRAVPLIIMDVFGVYDTEVIMAALLHDAIEDCGYTKEKISRVFGENVGMLVDGVSIPTGNFASREERMAVYHRKFLAAVEKDVRALFIKLADRLHNLSTCHSLSREAQVKNVMETDEFYIPLAKEYGAPYRELEEIIVSIKKRLKIE